MSDLDASGIIDALDRISEAVVPNALQLFIAPIASTFFGALFAFYLAKWQEKRKDEKNDFARLLQKIMLEISAVELACTKYWAFDCSARSSGDELILQQQVSGGFPRVSTLRKEFERRMPANVAATEASNVLQRFCVDGFEVAAGDDFGSVRRTASPAKITAVSQYAQEVRDVLSRF